MEIFLAIFFGLMGFIALSMGIGSSTEEYMPQQIRRNGD